MLHETFNLIIGLCSLAASDSKAWQVQEYQDRCHKYYVTCIHKKNEAGSSTQISDCIKEKPTITLEQLTSLPDAEKFAEHMGKAPNLYSNVKIMQDLG